jgi:hypothetical protein
VKEVTGYPDDEHHQHVDAHGGTDEPLRFHDPGFPSVSIVPIAARIPSGTTLITAATLSGIRSISAKYSLSVSNSTSSPTGSGAPVSK